MIEMRVMVSMNAERHLDFNTRYLNHIIQLNPQYLITLGPDTSRLQHVTLLHTKTLDRGN
jgi:hypothetical protein